MRAINDLIVEGAEALGLEDGKKLRGDTTVAETDIHYPTDASLLSDTVRVITRLVGRLVEKVKVPVEGFRDRTRSGRRRMHEIHRMTPRNREKQQVKKYKELIKTTEEVVESARSALEQTKNAIGEGLTGHSSPSTAFVMRFRISAHLATKSLAGHAVACWRMRR